MRMQVYVPRFSIAEAMANALIGGRSFPAGVIVEANVSLSECRVRVESVLHGQRMGMAMITLVVEP